MRPFFPLLFTLLFTGMACEDKGSTASGEATTTTTANATVEDLSAERPRDVPSVNKREQPQEPAAGGERDRFAIPVGHELVVFSHRSQPAFEHTFARPSEGVRMEVDYDRANRLLHVRVSDTENASKDPQPDEHWYLEPIYWKLRKSPKSDGEQQ